MTVYSPSGWFSLKLAAAIGAVIVFLQSWIAKRLLEGPINVKVIRDPPANEWGKSGWGPGGGWGEESDSEPELLKTADGDSGSPKSPRKPVPRFCHLEQVWNPTKKEYVEYAPRPPRKVPTDDELLYWFKVYSRRETRKKDEKPAISVEFHSHSLINFLRSVLGREEAFESRPVFNIHKLYRLRGEMSRRMQRLVPSELQLMEFEAMRQFAHSLGVQDALSDDVDEAYLLKHFEILARQLNELMSCLNKEFEPILEEVKMYLSHGHITFRLLGYAVKPGDKLLMYDRLSGDKYAWSLVNTKKGQDKLHYKGTDVDIKAILRSRTDDRTFSTFTLVGTGREWNGSRYKTALYSRTVHEWSVELDFILNCEISPHLVPQGTKSVTSLPWRTLGVEDEKELTERGRIYCQYSGIYHVYNNGPLGGSGRAMVDCGRPQDEDAWVTQKSGWGQQGNVRGNQASGWGNQASGWGNQDETTDVAGGQQNNLNESSRHNEESEEDSEACGDSTLSEEELCFLPPTVEGFMLRAKEWVSMHVLSLAPVKFDRHAWDHLVLDPDTKLLIRSLVYATCKGSSKDLVRDVITGKGGGLVSVLHGKPGTGKTLTAEAVAEHLGRPIYIVGSEELPFDAVNLESRLRRVLNLSARWDAVLLIDEADVLLEQRSLHELQRNAVVSVALRLLEYHSGVLFLTTNRIKSFDEAFLSRFSIGIKYPDLDQASRLKIWQSFLRLANVKVVDQQEDLDAVGSENPHVFAKDLESLAERSFNGRSIKNLVRTAQALALANEKPLTIEHLRIVVNTSERFLRDFEEITNV